MNNRLPAWAYAAIAGGPATILAFFYDRLDAVSRLELLIPAVFWTLAFGVIGWRSAHR